MQGKGMSHLRTFSDQVLGQCSVYFILFYFEAWLDIAKCLTSWRNNNLPTKTNDVIPSDLEMSPWKTMATSDLDDFPRG